MRVSSKIAAERTLRTPRGDVLLVRDPPFEYIFPLAMGEGLGVFFHYRDRDARMTRELLSAATKGEDNRLVCAVHDHAVIGYVMIVPAEPGTRWFEINEALIRSGSDLEHPVLLELGSVEVARPWRSSGVGGGILRFAFEDPHFERKIVISRELSWHWDLKAAGLDAYGYRTMLLRFFERVGFRYCETDDNEIAYSGENMLTARVGGEVPPETALLFHRSLVRSEPRGWGWG